MNFPSGESAMRSIALLPTPLLRGLVVLLLVMAPWLAQAQTCAPPSSLISALPGSVVNDYYAGSGTPNLSPGSTSLVLGPRDSRGYTTAMAVGDLLLVMQMQDGSINASNNSNYGAGTGSGSGSTSVGSAGLYEFVRVTAVSGSNITFTPALTNSYVNADATASTSQKRYQVIRVLQFSSVTAAGVIAPAWNGATGGVAAMDVRDTLTLGGATVEGQSNRAVFVAGKGFRGGWGRSLTTTAGANSEQDYAVASTVGYHGSKGEGILGTPYYAATKTNPWGYQTTNPPALASTSGPFEGYPGGSYARGAPGNAGGGGVDGATPSNANDKNAGGGGGGNYGPGGIGGRPWSRPLLDTGGRGGAGYAGTLAFNRVFMGGGGGAGSTNNATADSAVYINQGISCTLGTGQCSSGAAGGGLVILRARNITGSGVIDARGAHGYNVLNDSGGGGGAGGSVVLETPNGGIATVDVTGGDGGNAWAGNASWSAGRHGPGGSGGGGFIAYAPNSMAVAASVDGGAPGQTMSNSAAAGGPTIEYYGSTGFNGGITTFQSPNVPGVVQAALCDPNLSLAKTDRKTALTSPGTNSYTFTVTNSGNGASYGTVSIADKLPPGLSVTPGPLTLSGPSAGNWNCTAANATDISCASTVSIAGSGGTSVFVVSTNVNGTNGLSVVNRAVVSGGGDPAKTTTATVSQASLCTANNTPAGCAVDTDTIVAPNLSLAKTNGVTTVATGSTVAYSLSVTNGGGAATAGTITVADLLPAGLSFAGTSPFNVAGFSCSVSGQGITCNRTTALATSATAVITYNVLVSPTAPSSVVNLAQVGGGGDPTPGKSSLPTTATAALCAAPVPPADTYSDPNTGCASDVDNVRYVSLELSKDDGKVFVSQGGTTDYLLVVTNNGTMATTGQLNFGDVLPTLASGSVSFLGTAGVPFIPGGPNGANWSCTKSSNTYTFCLSTVSIPAGGTSGFILSAAISAAAAANAQTLNRARVGGGGDVTPGGVNSPTVADIQACTGDGNGPGCAIDLNTIQVAPEIRLSKSHPDPQARSVGSTFAFTLTIRNSGGSASGGANTIRMIDVIPPNLTIGSLTAASPFTCSTAGQVITCNNTAGALAAGQSAVITVPVTVAAASTNPLVNRAQVGTSGADPQNATYPTTTTVALCSGVDAPAYGCATDPVPLNADLQIVKDQRRGTSGAFQSSLLGVSLGDTVQYRLQVSNAAGSALVSTATFSDLVPFHITSLSTVSFTASGGATGCTAAFNGSLLSGTVTTLPAGSTCTVVVQGTASTSSGGATNTAVVTAPAGITDTVPGNNTSTVYTAIGSANLSVTKSNGVGTLSTGATTTYTITVANAGPSPADGARLYDPVAPGLSCTAPPVCVASGAATCPAGLTMAQLQNATVPTGVAIPTLGAGGGLTLTVQCLVTATGQ